MNKVTYLFGAGASAKAVPIVNKIPERLINFRNAIEKVEGLAIPQKEKEGRDLLINEIENILKQIVRIEHTADGVKYHPLQASIDTYAKKLFIKQEFDSLDKLKAVLCVFFSFEQSVKDPDLRYDSFFASIINGLAYNLPRTVNVVSWNYDFQFELAYSKFSNDPRIQNNMTSLNVITKLTRENKDPLTDNLKDKFSIFKINGTAAYHDHLGKLYPLIRTNETISPELQAITSYSNWAVERRGFSSLSFAWEGHNETSALLELFKVAAKDTVALVIIGYSIPFFNREVDRKIIEAMPNLKKVYFQSPEADALKERFSAFKEMDPAFLVSKTNTDQFYLPNELSL